MANTVRANKYVLAQRAAARFCKNPTAANKTAMEASISRYSSSALEKGKTVNEIQRIASKLRSCQVAGNTIGKAKTKRKRVGTTTTAATKTATAAVGKTRKKTAKRKTTRK